MATELILVRHGNAIRIHGDYYHAPLTTLGNEQAAQTGQYFNDPQNHIDGFYSSPLRRTRETATIIGSVIGKTPLFRPGIQELQYFELPGLMLLEFLSIADPVEDYLDARAGRSIRWPIEGRVAKVLLNIIARHPDQRVAVITHAGVISATLSWYIPEKRWRWWRTTVSNCSMTRFSVEGNQAKLIAVNDITHLSPVDITTQPPTKTVEIAKETHPSEKALLPTKPDAKK